jgi:multiple sugar transport system substrate-binding protein
VTEAFFLRQDNGAQLQRDLISGDADFTDERVTSALQEIVDLHEKGYWSTTREFATQFEYMWDGTLPLYFQGSFTPGMEAIQDASDLDIFRLPGTEAVTGSVNWFTIPSYSEKVDAAKEVLGALISPDGQKIWAQRGGFISPNTQVPASAYDAEVTAKITELTTDVTVVPDLDDALGNPFQEEFWSQLKGLWSDPSSDLGDITSTLDQAQDDTLSE